VETETRMDSCHNSQTLMLMYVESLGNRGFCIISGNHNSLSQLVLPLKNQLFSQKVKI